jgi:hypothetical protein
MVFTGTGAAAWIGAAARGTAARGTATRAGVVTRIRGAEVVRTTAARVGVAVEVGASQ